MRLRALIGSIGIGLIVTCLAAGCSSGISSPGGRRAPFTRYYLMDGRQVSSAEFSGMTSFVLFWSAQCPHSRRLIRDVARVAARHHGTRGAIFLAVSVDEAEEASEVKDFIDRNSLSSMVHAFSGNDVYDEAYMAFNVDRLPYVFVVNPSGEIVAEGIGVGAIEDLLEKLN